MVHGSVHTLFRVVFGAALLSLALIAFLAWRLSTGPLSMDALAPYVADALEAEDGSISFEIDGVVLSWVGLTSNPEIRATNVTAVDQDGSLIASFPYMVVGLSLDSLLEGVPSPRQIILDKPIVRLSRSVGGQFSVGVKQQLDGALSPDSDLNIEFIESSNALVASVVSALSAPGAGDNPGGYLEVVAVRDATVIFSDQISGTEWVVPEGQIVLERYKQGVSIKSDLPFLNEGKTSNVEVDGTLLPADLTLDATLTYEGVRPDAFANLTPGLSFLAGADVTLNGTLALSVFVGDVVSVDTVQLSLVSSPGSLYVPAPINKTYDVSQISLEAALRERLDLISIDKLELELQEDGPTILLSAEGRGIREAPQATAKIAIDELTIEQLKDYWPAEIKPNTKRWITQNLNGGVIKNAIFDAEANGASLSEFVISGFTGQASLSGVAVSYLRGMPPVIDTFGSATFSPSEVVIDVEGGRVNQGTEFEDLTLREARVRLHNLDKKGEQWADIDVRIDSGLRDAIALIDNEPLRYATALGVDPSVVSGQAEVLLSVDIPLLKDLTLAQVQIGATASLQETSVAQAGLGLDLEAGQFSLTLDNEGMDVTGTAALGGIRTGLAWRENFSAGQFRRQYALDAVLENGQRSLIGLAQPVFAPPYLDGPVRVEAIYTVNRDSQNNRLIVEADLRDAALRVPELNWRKEVGTNGIFSSDIAISGNRLIAMRSFDLSSPDALLSLSGSLDFGDGPSVASVSVLGARIGNNAFDLKAQRAPDGVLDIEMGGEMLDGRTFWSSVRNNNRTRSLQDEGAQQPRMPFRFNGRLSRVLLSSVGEIRDVEASVEQTLTGLSQIQINSRVSDTAPFELTFREDTGVRRFQAQSPDGGAVLRNLGLGDDFVGGDFMVLGQVDPLGVVEGELTIESFNLVDAPLLARLLSVASLTGIVDELQGTGISFSKVSVPFTYSDQVFAIRDSAMYGSSLGLTASGQYDLAQSTLDGEGTIVPAYAVNSALGALPIVGPIFTGGEEGGGLFAATFAMRGNPEGGEITVNPLATLTPGFLREIFKIFDPPPAESVSAGEQLAPN